MMLASPYLPPVMFPSQHNPDDSTHFRPSKDMDAFNSLLPPPIEFVEGSSSGTLAVAEGKYEPINASPKPSKTELPESTHKTPPPPTKPSSAASRTTGAKIPSLYPGAIDTSWPPQFSRGAGLYNSGNTCFLNSALQCLIHTPPLIKLLAAHKKDDCRIHPAFCMTCMLRAVTLKAHSNSEPFSPSVITNNLQIIAKHMRRGRQEDTHEFLRYAIDALQKSCLAGHPPKIDPKLAETTWVHKLFGGRLRSRVTCRDCGHNSDTFDRILDLSLDIFKCDSLKGALRKFIAIDYLKGADKYKCEKCKKHVNAEKRFTIHEAPVVLTVHLKRFSPLGRKIGHMLSYDQDLSLHPYMSEGQFGPSYTLYGVICHAGGGPNSGHYYAFVKSRENRWWEMNDEMVQAAGVPTNKKNAYILFYIQNKGQGLEAAVKAPLVNNPQLPLPLKNGLAAGMKKKSQKPRESDDEDQGVKVTATTTTTTTTTFIGPLLPAAEIKANGVVSHQLPPSPLDPQALALKSKIAAAAKNQARAALESLDNYASDSSEEDDKKPKSPEKKDDGMIVDVREKHSENDKPSTEAKSSSSATPAPSLGIPPSSFYGTPNPSKKRKFTDTESENIKKPSSPIQARTKGYKKPLNPYTTTLNMKRKRMGI